MDWHGWSRSSEQFKGEALHVGPLPGRKQVAVYSIEYPKDGGAVMHVHAYCRTPEEGQKLLAVLDRLVDPEGRVPR